MIRLAPCHRFVRLSPPVRPLVSQPVLQTPMAALHENLTEGRPFFNDGLHLEANQENQYYNADADPYSKQTMLKKAYELWMFLIIRHGKILPPPHANLKYWQRKLHMVSPFSHSSTFAHLNRKLFYGGRLDTSGSNTLRPRWQAEDDQTLRLEEHVPKQDRGVEGAEQESDAASAVEDDHGCG